MSIQMFLDFEDDGMYIGMSSRVPSTVLCIRSILEGCTQIVNLPEVKILNWTKY
jgi:hypothetical protein